MGKKLVALLLTLVVLAVLSGGYVVGGLQAYSRYQKEHVAHAEYCGGQSPVNICVQAPKTIFSAFYPSYVTAQTPLFMVTYSSSTPLTLVVKGSVINFTQVTSQTVEATSAIQSMSFTPPLSGQVLRNLTSEMNTSLQVQVTDTHNHLYYLSDIPISLQSRWQMQWVATNRLLIAAWVTPDDPAVKELVLKAAITHLSAESPTAPGAMIGYTNASRQQVIDQVDAIYDALRLDYHIRYVQASVPYSGQSDTAATTENIKLPFEVLQQRSGMCIELTVLLASAVESIGLHAEIVIVPGHAFLGVSTTPNDSHIEYWDAVEVNNGVAADSDNIYADHEYVQNMNMHTILDTISIKEARDTNIGSMV